MALTKPDFTERDADKITAGMIAKYEADAGKTSCPAQAECPLIDLWTYREILVRVAVQEAAKRNLVALVREPMVNYLDELVGVYHLATQFAATTSQFSVGEALAINMLIPAGTHVSASDSVVFTANTDVVLEVGLLLASVTSTCTEPDTAGNDQQPTQVSQLFDKTDNVDLLVNNLTASSDGSEQEDDDRLRERIRLAPESFINTGSCGAYRFHAMQAHPNIVDVAVLSPVPGTVGLYPLFSTGLPNDGVLTLAESFCFDEKVRPLTDIVRAKTPVKMDYTTEARTTIYRSQDARSVKDTVNSTIQDWMASRTTTLGRDIVPGQIISALPASGVYQVELVTPTLRMTVESEQTNRMAITLNMTEMSDD